MDFFAATVILILVLDPFGNLPMLSGVLSKYSGAEQRKILFRETLIALGILLFFLFLGDPLLDFLGLDTSTLKISGGFILLLMGIGMLFPSKSVLSGPDDETDDEPFIVPIAIPLIAGPSALTYVMLMAKQFDGQLWTVTGAVFAAWAFSSLILFLAPLFMKFLGNKGMRAMERLMGMVLILISMQMMLDGIATFLNIPKP